MPALISNLQAFRRTLVYQEAQLKGQATHYYQTFVRSVLRDLSLNTPQWTGNLAASWQVVVGANTQAKPNYELEVQPGLAWTDLTRATAAFKGDPDAVMACLMANEPEIMSIRWNSHVSLVNTHPDLERGEIQESRLRKGNYIQGDIMAIFHVSEVYSKAMGHHITVRPR